MNNIEKKIISIGGGGFTHQLDESLDQFVIDQSKKSKNKIGFLDISKIIEKTLNETPTQNLDTLPSVVENDQLSRQLALSLISKND